MSAGLVGQPMTSPSSSEARGLGITVGPDKVSCADLTTDRTASGTDCGNARAVRC